MLEVWNLVLAERQVQVQVHRYTGTGTDGGSLASARVQPETAADRGGGGV